MKWLAAEEVEEVLSSRGRGSGEENTALLVCRIIFISETRERRVTQLSRNHGKMEGGRKAVVLLDYIILH